MHEKRFHGQADRLRSPERVARLEVERAVQLSLDGLPAVESILDVGTGSGLFAEALVAQASKVVGLDVNEEMLALARSLVPGADFRQGTQEAMPSPDDSFDLVFFGLVLHETDDLALALSEAQRCARLRAAVLEWLYLEEVMGPPLAHRLSPQRVQGAAEEAGFAQVTVLPLTYMVLYLFSQPTTT